MAKKQPCQHCSNDRRRVFHYAPCPVAEYAGYAAHGMTLRPQKILVSEALAVHPVDAAQAQANARAKGFNIHFDGEGRPHFSSYLQKERYMRSEGYSFIRRNKSAPGDYGPKRTKRRRSS